MAAQMAKSQHRCAWAATASRMVAYHDEEWGVPLLLECRQDFRRLVDEPVVLHEVIRLDLWISGSDLRGEEDEGIFAKTQNAQLSPGVPVAPTGVPQIEGVGL